MLSSGGEATAEGHSMVKSQADTEVLEGWLLQAMRAKPKVPGTGKNLACYNHEPGLSLTGASRWCVRTGEEALHGRFPSKHESRGLS